MSALLRVGSATLIVLALSQPLLLHANATRPHIVLLDLGSDPPLQTLIEQLHNAKQSSNDTRLIAFSNRCELVDNIATLTDPNRLADLKSRLNRPLWPDDPPAGGSNIAAALQLAGAELDTCSGGSIELLSTGYPTRGDAEAEAYRLAQKGIAIHVDSTAFQPRPHNAIAIRAVEAPSSARLGQSIPLSITVQSAITQPIQLTIAARDSIAYRSTQILQPGINQPGINHLSAAVPARTIGLTSFQVIATPSDYPPPASLTAATYVNPASRILLVKPDPADSAAARALRQILGTGADITEILPQQLDQQSLDRTSLLVLADVPINLLSHNAQNHILRSEQDGMGLLVTGTSPSFAPGNGDDSTLAKMLPVKIDQQLQRIDPSVALVLIIDSSGSMQGEKLDLAKAVARLAISHLDKGDKAGLVEFYGGKRWAAPLQSAANAAVIDRALDRLTAGGSTVLYPAVEEADFALRNVSARSKHVLIVSDGFVENAPFAALVRSMADNGVSVSTVGVKTNPQERNLMPAVAMWGRGRYYTVPDRFAVPDIALKQPQQTLIPLMITTPASLAAGHDSLLQNAASENFGTLAGYVHTIAKSNADVLLQTSAGDPILAKWRYGAGWTAALTTELGSTFTADLQNRPAFAQLLTALVRQISRSQNALNLQPIVRPAGVELDIQSGLSDPIENSQPLHTNLTNLHGDTVRTVDTEPIAPGHWNVLFAGLPAGIYRATADNVNPLSGACGFAINPPQPIKGFAPDATLITRLQQFAQLAGKNNATHSATEWIDLSRPLILASMALLLLHIACRRWPVSPSTTPSLELAEQAA